MFRAGVMPCERGGTQQETHGACDSHLPSPPRRLWSLPRFRGENHEAQKGTTHLGDTACE